MLHGIFALFFRSLRGDSRSFWVHLSWGFLLLVIYGALCFAQVQGASLGAPGRDFFRYVIHLDAVFVTLLGISYFSSAISEEKEEDTLGLMTMAGISPLGILLGKSTTRLFQVMLLFALQYPFTLLAITLGGLASVQIVAAYLSLLAYTTLLANIGLLCSVLCRRNRDAAALTSLWLVGYIFTPLFAYVGYQILMAPVGLHPFWIAAAPVLAPLLNWISETSIFSQLYAVTETGYQFSWSPQVISNILLGVASFLLSWGLFRFVSHEPFTESTTRTLVPRRMGRWRLFSAGRTWDWGLAWKDFHFTTGGWFGVLIRTGLYVGLYWLAFAATYPWEQTGSARQISWRDVTWGYQAFVIPLFTIDCALCGSRVFQEEIRYQTLAALLMLPRSVSHIVYMKLVGCLMGLLPGIVAILLAFLVLEGGQAAMKEAFRESQFWYLLANLFLVLHLTVTLSVYLRWGALAMALTLTVGSMIFSVVAIELTMQWSSQMRSLSQQAFGLMAVLILCACLSCHLAVLLRIPVLGEK